MAYEATKFLISGDVLFGKGPARVWTVLGSCVAAVFSSSGTGLWAICHAQLPERRDAGLKCTEACPDPCFRERPEAHQMRYVACAIRYMAERFKEESVPVSAIRIRLYGGATLFKGLSTGLSVGEKNIAAARDTLASLCSGPVQEDTGGSAGRTIIFDAGTDQIEVRVPSRDNRNAMLKKEVP